MTTVALLAGEEASLPLAGPQPRPALKIHVDGTHRSSAPEETLRQVQPWLSAAGITRVADITGLDRVGVPVFSVCRPNARSICVAQGKGLSRAAAKVSGIMEAIECFHAETINHPLRLASLDEMQMAGFEAWVADLPTVDVTPFSSTSRLLWIESVAWPSGEPCWIPHEIVHTDYRLPLPSGSGRFLLSSNGLASGNHLLEAVSHGLCELIERDATTLWMMAGGPGRGETRVALETVDDPACLQVLDRFRGAGVAAAVWETTTDIGVPAFLCIVADQNGVAIHPLGPQRGMGCHPCREIALLRALTEAAQTRLTVISGARDDLGRTSYASVEQEERRNDFLRTWACQKSARTFLAAPTHVRRSFDEDLAFLIERLRTVGLAHVYVVDLSRPGWPIAVARTVVPGLEPMPEAPGYSPGKRARRAVRRRR